MWAVRAPSPSPVIHDPWSYSSSSSCSRSRRSSSSRYRLVVVVKSSSSSFRFRPPPLFAPRVRALKYYATGGPTTTQGRTRHTFTLQMNLFDRFARVIKSYANAIISSFEDPDKILEQSVIEMTDDLIKMRQATAQVLASRKQLENKCKSAQQASEDWYRRAQLALGKGEEDLAREALKRRKSYADNANALKTQLDQQKSVVDNLVSNTRLLENKIQEARSKKDTLKARAQSAKTASKVSEMLGSVNTSSALSAFEKMEEKVLVMESQAEALNQLTTDDLEGKFAMLETSSVDDDLANLKKELSGSTKKGELPAGRPLGSALKYEDPEIEKELNELRQKAKEY